MVGLNRKYVAVTRYMSYLVHHGQFAERKVLSS